ncbi:alpha/beta hydrolase [Halarcobacter ebronensis]|uniref:Alpha/beta hydrolase n=1 Tax=Halarcobacter ebronensis TaxID=1462615 RepID=A0A4Q0YG25_9BACT|nr:alpha/beta hydrolase [Halarcobacter ebronensis]RXJ69537.1 alpha/beta hydrolase [Halarcobacter ebronensis]
MSLLGYKTIGKGKNYIIFLHELMGDCRNYEPIFNYLDQEIFTCLFVDLRGYGLSKNIQGEYNCLEASNDVKDLITSLNITTYSLVGHSMSTLIAQKIALIDIRVKKLILITPIPAFGIKMNHYAKEVLLNQMQENSNKIEQIVEDSSKRYNNSWKNYRIKMAYSSSILEARVGYMKMYLNIDFQEEAQEKIDIAIKIIVGKHDFPVFAYNQVNKNFSKYKDVEIIECSEAGHYPMIETPIFFASHIEKWCL